MIFNPDNLIKKDGTFNFSGKVTATANPCLNKEVLKEFWFSHTFRTSELEITETDELIFALGEAERPNLDGESYAINVEKSGVCLVASSETTLINGFMTLIDRIKLVGFDAKALKIDACEIKETALVKNRMVHFCVFPETELWELQKYIRLSGACKYSHIVLEFWGMLKLDALKEIAWDCGYTKEEIAPLIKEARDLGMEVIPMFNHWGHAPSSRVMHGKHVVLDQNPALQNYFTDTGWCWSIENKETRALLKKIRDELINVCGEGEYFHIGCDEAYDFDWSKESQEKFCEYINEVADDLLASGRRPIMWGDMLIYKNPEFNPKNRYVTFAPDKQAQDFMLANINKRIVIADWQYWAKEAPVETVFVFKKAGFDVLMAPWDCSVAESQSCIDTAKEDGVFGIMHTTWHTLTRGLPHVTRVGIGCFEEKKPCGGAALAAITAEKLRKVAFVNGDYEKAGWAKQQINIIT